MLARTDTIFHPTADSFGTLTVRAAAAPRANPVLMAAGLLLSLALALGTLYQVDRMVFAPATPVAHGEIFAVDMD
ncbi:hypothetical protein [Asticcacaulis solisilvae]|uniref:hypothetical protein n=1 Tax=Asticcacaulis solisilvae TaxID=1217274 RepID=UPI003FD7F5FB